MNPIFYTELQKHAKAFEAMSPEAKEQSISSFIRALKTLLMLQRLAYKEGLLQLEEWANNSNDDVPYSGYLSDMILLIVDGTDPNVIEDIALLRYSAKALEGTEGWIYLMYLFGALQIQEGTNPRILEQQLLAMLPKEAEEFWMKTEAEAAAQEAKNALNMCLMESLYEGELAIGPEHEAYLLMKTCDSLLSTLDNKSMDRLLRENINRLLLGTALKGLSGPARKNILTNLEPQTAMVLVDDYYAMKPVSFTQIATATQHIFTTLLELIRVGEISVPIDSLSPLLEWISLVKK